MRHLLANLAVYTLAALLVMGAALFAWARSSQLVLSDERTLLARFEPAAVHEFDWAELGADSYLRNCSNCHGRSGEGWDQYPGLAHTGAFLHAPGGRAYLVDLHLYGLTSPRWRAPMPRMGHMADVELAAVLNHTLVRFGGVDPGAEGEQLFVPAEVAARRGQRLSASEVNRQRPELVRPEQPEREARPPSLD